MGIREELPTFHRAGAQVYTVDLPSVSKATSPRFGLHVDAKAVRRTAEQIDGPVIAVAHSYGGAAATEGLSGLANVRHIVYLAAFALDIGESGESLLDGNLPSWWAIDGEVIMPTDAVRIFYHDIAADEAERAAAWLMPFSMSAVRQRLTTAAGGQFRQPISSARMIEPYRRQRRISWRRESPPTFTG
jgi:pimeloyl-ACP methyl ester carboxylesterase